MQLQQNTPIKNMLIENPDAGLVMCALAQLLVRYKSEASAREELKKQIQAMRELSQTIEEFEKANQEKFYEHVNAFCTTHLCETYSCVLVNKFASINKTLLDLEIAELERNFEEEVKRRMKETRSYTTALHLADICSLTGLSQDAVKESIRYLEEQNFIENTLGMCKIINQAVRRHII